MENLSVGGFIGAIIGVLIVGLAVGFFLSRWFFKRELQKNPPINEKMIRAMFQQMGRKPSEAQVRAVMNSMKRNG
ncbi:MAG: YneF family protein [Bacilli bacterium]|jgi:uncharacterized protein YneF (UPF0154 family)|nr:YneF family protein [Bacilli bacterium]